MSIPTFSPPRGPDFPAQRKRAARVLSLSFGDGYAQVSGDGLNAVADSITLSWSFLSRAEADAIDAFFADRAGREAFWWQSPYEARPQKWRCTEWSRSRVSGAYDSMTATFTEVFDLD